MKFASLLVSCACLLLLQLEMGAARATSNGGPSESLYALARDLGLDAAGVDEMWRTGKPLVIRKEMGPNDVTTVTYTLNPETNTIFRKAERMASNWQSSSFRFRERWGQPQSHQISQPDSVLANFFLNPFLNPFGSGFSQSFFENWVRSLESNFPCCPVFPNQPPINQNDRYPNDRNPVRGIPSNPYPVERNPSAGYPNTPSIVESNSNDAQWVPAPETTTKTPVIPLPTRAPSNTGDRVIDDFLAKVDVTTSDIKDEDGEYVRTIVDNNGRILKAKFELVETKSQEKQANQ